MPKGNYRSVSINDKIIDHVKKLIETLRTYHSVSEFISEAVRLRVETLEKHYKGEGKNET
jgi:Arc/MetJ-type ribon-helix-helix transcriptional regulator